ncbi:MAG TPA: hypothetical protein VG410_08225 [Solirubrobacteraceae bacterium]|jgi:hypothetical protein|nr:hypothetical protein [Solirubrobacteraceae bacterium]
MVAEFARRSDERRLAASGCDRTTGLRLAVRTHTRSAMTKVDARSRAHLVAKALAEVRYRPTP